MKHFALRNAAFAAIWLIFLLPAFLQVLVLPDYSSAQRVWAAIITFAFAAAYFLSFGSLQSWPRGWSQRQRVALRWVLLAVLALAAIPAYGVWTVVFLPYLGAIIAYTQPLTVAGTIVALTGCAASIPAWYFGRPVFVSLSLIIFGWPLFIVVLGALSQRSDTETALRHDLALAQQRENIASDIHDLLGHTLTAINLKAEVARRYLERDPAHAASELEEISSLSRRSLAEVRSTVTRMKNPTFAGEVQAARRILDTAGIRAHIPENFPHPSCNEDVFSWGLRELTTNVVRHSGAKHCWVFLAADSLQVSDDGGGFTDDAARALASGLTGLAGLRRRAEDAGGTVIIQRSGSVTSVLVTFSSDHTVQEV
ncbi:sensor histidine kinase [Corynebacterium sp. LaCa116]|uniref:sensor histidine kinase n=1 Tax=Corynebacterium sp. LaCa116 TaxID=3391423 RepID=UPI003989C2A6